jgi:hypothetical protein
LFSTELKASADEDEMEVLEPRSKMQVISGLRASSATKKEADDLQKASTEGKLMIEAIFSRGLSRDQSTRRLAGTAKPLFLTAAAAALKKNSWRGAAENLQAVF